MNIFPDISTNRRKDSGIEPNGELLAICLVLLALSGLAFSLPTLDLAVPYLRTICLAVGAALGIGALYHLIKYGMQLKAFHDFHPYWDKGRGMYDRFAAELNNWYKNDTLPQSCDGDTTYFLKLQKKRLNQHNIRLHHEVLPVKGQSFGTVTFTKPSLWYTTDMVYEDISRKMTFSRDEKTLYTKTSDQVMYQNILHSPNEAQLSSIQMTCPSCGAVAPVSRLTEGCEYCGSKFHIVDLFPRVTNLYFVKNKSHAHLQAILRYTLFVSIVAFFVLYFPTCRKQIPGNLPLALLACDLVSVCAGGFSGLIIADAICLMSLLFHRDGRKHIPLKALSSKRKLCNLMRPYDRNFSYEKFESRLVSLIRMAVFSEDPKQLASFAAASLDSRTQEILEMTYTSGLCIQNIWLTGSILHLCTRTWWVDYSVHGSSIRRTGDCFDVTVRRDISKIEPPGFSITSVSCPNCGGSFDAVQQCICPYCNTPYHMEENGWVIEDMKLIR